MVSGPALGIILLLEGGLFVLVGLLVYFASEMYLAIREIAHNTRKEASSGNNYSGLETACSLTKVMGIIVVVLGALAGVFGIITLITGGGRMF